MATQHSMFWAAKAFNQDLSGWSISSATKMSMMFYEAEAFNQNLCQWVDGMKNLGSQANHQCNLAISCTDPEVCGAFMGETCTSDSDCNADLSYTCYEGISCIYW